MTEIAKTKQDKKSKFYLGSENVFKTFLTILIPTLIAQIIAGTFVVFDTFFVSKGFQAGAVGNGIGESLFVSNSYSALGPAAVSYAMPYTFFIIGVGLMVGAGLASIMTKAYATKDKNTLQDAMNSYMPLTIIFGVSMMILLLIFAKVFVWFGSGFQKDYIDAWFNNPLMNPDWGAGWADATTTTGYGPQEYREVFDQINGHILSQSAWYLRIQAFGAIPYMYMAAGVIMLRVQGKAQYATAFTAIGLVTNIILDFVFIIVLKMNVVGAAIATVIGQFATAAAYLIYFKMFSEVKQTKNNWSYATTHMGNICKSGVSIMMLQVLTGLVLIIFTFSIGVANYGDMSSVTNYTAVYQGYNAVYIFLNLAIVGIAQSMAPIVGYNAVKGDAVKVKKARNYGLGLSFIFGILSWILIMLFAQNVIGIFYTVNGTTADFITSGQYEQLIYTNGLGVATLVLRLLFLTFPIAVMINISGTYLQSIGKDKESTILLFGKVFALIPVIIILILIGDSLDIVSGEWVYLDANGLPIVGEGIESFANLNVFVALPIVDVIFLVVLIIFIIDAEKNVINKMEKVTVEPNAEMQSNEIQKEKVVE